VVEAEAREAMMKPFTEQKQSQRRAAEVIHIVEGELQEHIAVIVVLVDDGTAEEGEHLISTDEPEWRKRLTTDMLAGYAPVGMVMEDVEQGPDMSKHPEECKAMAPGAIASPLQVLLLSTAIFATPHPSYDKEAEDRAWEYMGGVQNRMSQWLQERGYGELLKGSAS
jgi:hypothetical protein